MKNERSESNDPIDALIDDAARRLVAGEPSSSLRIGVRHRIDGRRSAWMLVPAWAAAMAIVIAAVLVGRSFLSSPDGREVVVRNPQPGGPEVPAVQTQASAPPAAIQPARTPPRQFTRRLATAIVPPPVKEEESLIPPLAIAPLATTQIAVDTSSEVTPIEIAPLQIEPLLGQ